MSMNAVPIRTPFVDWVLDGKKVWEIRSRATQIRGRIGLIRSKSLTVVGHCELVDVIGPLTEADIRKNARSKMGEPVADCLDCVGMYAWVLTDVRRLVKPVPYHHPSGAVTWVKLDDTTQTAVLRAKSAAAGSARK